MVFFRFVAGAILLELLPPDVVTNPSQIGRRPQLARYRSRFRNILS